MTDLKGKVALETDSARGLGRAIAERFGQLGASVVVNYAGSEAAARDAAAAIEASGGEAIAIRADVSRPAEIEAAGIMVRHSVFLW
jgi:3-oxoacyl-[acyl-carrier protein] reductase